MRFAGGKVVEGSEVSLTRSGMNGSGESKTDGCLTNGRDGGTGVVELGKRGIIECKLGRSESGGGWVGFVWGGAGRSRLRGGAMQARGK